MAAIPIITAAVAVAGTAASISQQNAQVSAQNQAINAQISADKNAEEVRRMQNDFQRKVIQEQYQVEKLARQEAFKEEDRQLREAIRNQRFAARNETQQRDLQVQQGVNDITLQSRGLQNQIRSEATGIINQLQNDAGNATNKNFIETDRLKTSLLGQSNEATLQNLQTNLQSNEAVTQALQAATQTAAQTNQAAQSNRQSVEQGLRQLSNNAAQIRGLSGQGRTTDQLTKVSVADIANQISTALQMQGINAEAADKVLQSKEYAEVIQKIANNENAIQQQSLGRQQQNAEETRDLLNKYLTRQLNLGVQGVSDSELQQRIFVGQNRDSQVNSALANRDSANAITNQRYQDFRDQARLARKNLVTDRKVGNKQAQIDKLFAEASLVTGQSLGAAQAAQRQAALASQRAQGPSAISQIAALGSSIVPLISAIQQSSAMSTPQTGFVPGGLGAGVGAGFGSSAGQGSGFGSSSPYAGSSLLSPNTGVYYGMYNG